MASIEAQPKFGFQRVPREPPCSVIVLVQLLFLALTTPAEFTVNYAVIDSVFWLFVNIQGAIALGTLVVVCRHEILRED